MEAKKAGKDLNLDEVSNSPAPEHKPSEREQAETARRLKPHSRGPTKPDVNHKPQSLTPVPVKKSRPTRWQFGIRSRNQPLEAMGCIYRALQELGAEWKIKDDDVFGHDDDDNDDEEDGGALHHETSLDRGSRGDSNISFSRRNAEHKILPADPWVLQVRWRKEGTCHSPHANFIQLISIRSAKTFFSFISFSCKYSCKPVKPWQFIPRTCL